MDFKTFSFMSSEISSTRTLFFTLCYWNTYFRFPMTFFSSRSLSCFCNRVGDPSNPKRSMSPDLLLIDELIFSCRNKVWIADSYMLVPQICPVGELKFPVWLDWQSQGILTWYLPLQKKKFPGLVMLLISSLLLFGPLMNLSHLP